MHEKKSLAELRGCKTKCNKREQSYYEISFMEIGHRYFTNTPSLVKECNEIQRLRIVALRINIISQGKDRASVNQQKCKETSKTSSLPPAAINSGKGSSRALLTAADNEDGKSSSGGGELPQGRAKRTASNTAPGCPKTAVWEMVMKHRDGLSGRWKERSLARRREGARERGITN